MFRDINPGSGGSFPVLLSNLFPSILKDVNGLVYVAADDGVHGRELWRTDGTPDGTVLVRDINPGSIGSLPGNLAIVNGVPLFQANDGVHGIELWRSDGTADGTAIVKDINPGSGSILQRPVMQINGTLFFGATDGVNGQELWRSDGTADGTMLVKDIFAGASSSDPTTLTNVNGTLFFNANDGVHGLELWRSDGTAAGTVMVKDINPIGTLPSQVLHYDQVQTTEGVPTRIDVLANDSFFAGTTGTITAVSTPTNGAVALNADQTITYTSAVGFSAFDVFTYTVTNSDGEVNTATVSVEVFPADFAKDDYAQTSQDTPVTIYVKANDIPTPGATITAIAAPAHGSAALNTDGTITYTPRPGYYGNDSFTYTVRNSVGGLDTATVTVQVAQRLQVDIKPGDTTNAISLNNGSVIPVTLFGSAAFDVTTANIASIRLAGASVAKFAFDDVNHDGYLDLKLQFNVGDTGLRDLYAQLLLADAADGKLDSTRQNTSLRLTGSTTDGRLFEGEEAVTLFMTGKELDDLLAQLGLQ